MLRTWQDFDNKNNFFLLNINPIRIRGWGFF